MLTVALSGNYEERLAGLPHRLRQALLQKATGLAAELEAKVQQKLAGSVLDARTGALARSIVTTIEDSSENVAVMVGSNGDVKYAAIHEFGGVIPPHEILPDKAKALAFIAGGKQTFAVRANLQAITMPERSYLRSSLAEMADEIKEELAQSVADSMQ
jgi:phage gpG-like protein